MSRKIFFTIAPMGGIPVRVDLQNRILSDSAHGACRLYTQLKTVRTTGVKKMHFNQKIFRFSTLGVLFFAISATGAQEAVAKRFNLTGTWKGYAVCEELKGGHFTFDAFPEPLSISHRADRIRISTFGVLYEGVTQTIPKSQLRGEANDC